MNISTTEAASHYNLGNTLAELGRLEDAATSYKRAIAIKPDFVEAHYNLSNTLKELGRLEEALVSVIKSIKINPIIEAKGLFVEIIKKIDVSIIITLVNILFIVCV